MVGPDSVYKPTPPPQHFFGPMEVLYEVVAFSLPSPYASLVSPDTSNYDPTAGTTWALG